MSLCFTSKFKLEAEKHHAEMLQRKKDLEEQERLKKIAEERQREKERLLELEKEREIEAEKLRLAEEERKREWQKKKEERFDLALDNVIAMGLVARKPDFIDLIMRTTKMQISQPAHLRSLICIFVILSRENYS